jgi:hypothetical protein
VITVTRVLPYDHARLASGVAVFVVAGGILTPGYSLKFWLCYMCLLFSQAWPGAQRDRFPGRVVERRRVAGMAPRWNRNTVVHRRARGTDPQRAAARVRGLATSRELTTLVRRIVPTLIARADARNPTGRCPEPRQGPGPLDPIFAM